MRFTDNVYNFNFFFFWLGSQELQKFEKKHGINPFHGSFETLYYTESDHYHQLILFRFSKENWESRTIHEKVSLIAHEAEHAKDFAFACVGIRNHESAVNEHSAYYLGYIASELAKILL
jgi:hypothetical protein